MPDVEKLCCPECKEKSTMNQGGKGKLVNKTHELSGGEFSRFGSAVKKGDTITYYHCKICDEKWDRSELETTETEWTTVSWTDPKTGERVIRRQKKGSQVGSRKKSGKSYWKKQDSLLKKLRGK